MMPILDVQRRVAVIGHIRLGERGPRGEPRALQRFRFTSPRETLIATVARRFGGEPLPWQNPATKIDEYEVRTDATELDVLVPPSDVAFSQWYELWGAAGCERRCDGITETRGNEPRDCVCAHEGSRRCDAVTRLSLLVPEIATVFGVWRLETSSYYASGELASAVSLALGLAERRAEHLAAATLRIEQRVARRPGEKPHRFAVPVLDVHLARGALTGPDHTGVPELPQRAAHGNVEPVAARASDAAAALTVVSLPEPAPRIDRGEPSPPPRPLEDSATRSDASSARLPSVAEDSPRPEPALTRDADSGAGDTDERQRRVRYLFVLLGKHFAGDDAAQRDERRAALAIAQTARTRGTDNAVSSWAQLTIDEVHKLEGVLQDIGNGQITMDNTVGGYVFTFVATGRKVYVRRDASGQWQYHTADNTR